MDGTCTDTALMPDRDDIVINTTCKNIDIVKYRNSDIIKRYPQSYPLIHNLST